MSWDILIQDLPKDLTSVAQISPDFQPGPLGQRSALIERIREFAPSADFSDPSWGDLVTPAFSVEFNMGRDEVCDSVMLHVRGGGAASDFVGGLLHHLGLRAIDCSEGELFNDSTASASFARWRDYRDRVLGRE
jgi:hypothetical protein